MRWLFACFGVLIISLSAIAADAAPDRIEHALYVRLEPRQHLLVGTDDIIVSEPTAAPISFSLSPRARIRQLTIDGEPVGFRFQQGRVTVIGPTAATGSPVRVRVEYAAVFNDPLPQTPVNTDNPGYGVAGIIGEKGTFILPGAGWYPLFDADDVRMAITIDAPEGISAVTAGRSAGRSTAGGRTLSYWNVDGAPPEGLALSAGHYVISEEDAGGIQVATYFSPATQPLSESYIAATKRYLRMYADLFGPYPFDKFAVVENFFPTGYGFPSYTLIGGTVLRLPFIIDVSLGHEIAHCWWGNGVRVDASTGNWSEGLTTYVADYRYKELESAEAAETHRRRFLRNYSTLVDETKDFPLSRFASRIDPATQAVGYGKAAMVFHMLRQILGEEAFWGGLRDVYKSKLFQSASWEDFRVAFGQRAAHIACVTLADFFEQWIDRAGAPMPALKGVARMSGEDGWMVSGAIVQRQPHLFTLPITISVETLAGTSPHTVCLHERVTEFAFESEAEPTAVRLDPETHVFRRLFPEEIPASVNTIKGAEFVTLVVSRTAGRSGRQTANVMIQSMGLSQARIVAEDDFNPDAAPGSLVFIGLPADPGAVPVGDHPISFLPGRFSLAGQMFDAASHAFFGVFSDPGRADMVAGILHPVGPHIGPLVAAKLTHYGNYSYLVFEEGQNVVKGIWPVTTSPLVAGFTAPQPRTPGNNDQRKRK